jgi:hypothetical protein
LAANPISGCGPVRSTGVANSAWNPPSGLPGRGGPQGDGDDTDLARFALALQKAYDGQASPIISPAGFRQMVAPQPGSPNYGLGITRLDQFFFGHGGSTHIFSSQWWTMGLMGGGFVVMANGAPGQLKEEIFVSLARLYEWVDEAGTAGWAYRLADNLLHRYAGRYLGRGGEGAYEYEIVIRDGGLVATNTLEGGPPDLPLFAMSPTRLVTSDYDLEALITLNAAGEATALDMRQRGVTVFRGRLARG